MLMNDLRDANGESGRKQARNAPSLVGRDDDIGTVTFVGASLLQNIPRAWSVTVSSDQHLKLLVRRIVCRQSKVLMLPACLSPPGSMFNSIAALA